MVVLWRLHGVRDCKAVSNCCHPASGSIYYFHTYVFSPIAATLVDQLLKYIGLSMRQGLFIVVLCVPWLSPFLTPFLLLCDMFFRLFLSLVCQVG